MSAALLTHQIATSCDVIADGLRYLDGAIADKGFIADGSYADLRLINYERRLREAANAIKARRTALLANEKVLFLQAAE